MPFNQELALTKRRKAGYFRPAFRIPASQPQARWRGAARATRTDPAARGRSSPGRGPPPLPANIQGIIHQRTMTPFLPDLVIYHANCNDGWCAYWLVEVLASKLGFSVEGVPAQYGDEPPGVRGRKVWVVDFSYPRDVLLRMADDAEQLLVLDHHRTARQQLDGLPFCVFDETKSGAMLVWEYIRDNWMELSDERRLVEYVQDRDLWKWELPHSREVNAALFALPKDTSEWSTAARNLDWLIDKGHAILSHIRMVVGNTVEKCAIDVEVNGLDFSVVNSSVYVSEIGEELLKDCDVAVIWCQLGNGKYLMSLRSRGNIDVSEMAKRIGGGGHKNAAGAVTDKHPLELLATLSQRSGEDERAE